MKTEHIQSFRKALRKLEIAVRSANINCCPGISMPQCSVLLDIYENERTNTVQLAANLRLDKSTLSRTVNSLVRAGLVKRTENSNDRRYTILSLTDKGTIKAEEITSENNNYYMNALSKVRDEDPEIIIANFEVLARAITDYQDSLEQNQCCDGRKSVSSQL